jgi:hypothetical protein
VGDGGLTQNNFTDALKTKLDGIEASATADQTNEEIQDIVGAMVSGNTESGITVTYQDSDGTLDFSVASQTDNNFTDADHTKLDGIEASATADQTGSEIKSLYENESDTNAFTDADHTKLDGISAGANVGITDVVGDTSPQLGGSLDVNSQDIVSTSNGDIDLDPNGSGKIVSKGNATRGSGQVKLNCEQNTHGVILKGPPHSAAADYTFTLPNDIQNGKYLTTDANGNTSWGTPTDTNTTYSVGDGGLTTNDFTDADHTKLDGIEASADVTDATNVNAAGAVMNSDLATKGQILVGDGSGDPTALSVGTNNHVLTADSSEATGVKWAAVSGGGGSGLFASYARISDTKAYNVQGGASTDATTFTRTLNTEDFDPDGIVSLSSNQFTLGAGSYFIKYRTTYMQTDRSLAYIYDITASSVIQSSVSHGYSIDSSADDGDNLIGSCRITISSNNVYELRHYTQTARADYGLGLAHGVSGISNVYSFVEIFKES